MDDELFFDHVVEGEIVLSFHDIVVASKRKITLRIHIHVEGTPTSALNTFFRFWIDDDLCKCIWGNVQNKIHSDIFNLQSVDFFCQRTNAHRILDIDHLDKVLLELFLGAGQRNGNSGIGLRSDSGGYVQVACTSFDRQATCGIGRSKEQFIVFGAGVQNLKVGQLGVDV